MSKKLTCTLLLLGTLLLTACSITHHVDNTDEIGGGSDAVSTDTASVNQEADSSTSDNTAVSDNQSSKVIDIKITVINLCGVDIGGFAVKDALYGEQVVLGDVPNEKSMTANIKWIQGKDTLEWAVYNTNMELVTYAESDVSNITEEVTISLSGDRDIEVVDVEVK
jgi:hypothetical protein